MSLRSAGLIDLHLHTTASDGRCSPGELVVRAAHAGVSVMAVTDHDTTAATAEVRDAAREQGVHTITGIEITAVDDERDVHVLGYLIDPDEPRLAAFLARQRAVRFERVKAIAARLASLGLPVDVEPLLQKGQSGRSLGRPEVARAMVAAGHVGSVQEAFDRFLGQGLPGFIPREGAPSEEVVAVIHGAGGMASLAHPGKFNLEKRLPGLAEAGLDAVEVFHPDHDPEMVERYRRLASDLRLLTTGGSDFHGDPDHGREPGRISLPALDFERLCEVRPDAAN